jgi:hypothetical protein
MPGTTTRPFSSMTRVEGDANARTSASVPTATMRSPRIASASAHGRLSSAVKTFPPASTTSGAGAADLQETSNRKSPAMMLRMIRA